MVIEETVVETFSFELPEDVDIWNFVRTNYYGERIILESGECQFRQMKVHDLTDNSWTDWKEF